MKKSLIFLFLLFIVYNYKAIAADDSFEPNNSMQQAATLALGNYALIANDSDWFKVTVEPGILYLQMQHPGGEGVVADLNMTLYNNIGQVVSANFVNYGTETILYSVVTGGDYFIKIEPTSILKNTYQLQIATQLDFTGDDRYENNDSIDKASLINLNSSVDNLISQDDDWFAFDTGPGILNVTALFSSAQGNIDLDLYNSQKQRIGGSRSENNNPFTSNGRTFSYDISQAGRYYLATRGRGGLAYALLTSHTTLWQLELNYGPITKSSITLSDIDADGTDEILVGTTKAFDQNNQEIRPAALLCINANGTLRWATTFPAISTPDPITGKIYQTSSIGATPVVGDIDKDGYLDIIIGVGGVDQKDYGDKGGLYALNALDGSIKWFHQSIDRIGGSNNQGDGRPDGVFSSAVIYDVDKDNKPEVIYGGWDQRLWVLDGSTGQSKTGWPIDVLDTIWASPAVADLNQDGFQDILMPADITANTDAKTQTGGIFHVFNRDGQQNIPGFDQFIGNPNYTTLIGKWEEEVLWSSPVVADIDLDGMLEIAYGTGNYHQDSRGSFIRVLEQNGNNRFKLDTNGKTFATPLFADLDNDGTQEIIATTLNGYVHAWRANGQPLFTTPTSSFGATISQPIFSSPLAVDLNNDGKLEIIYSQGAQLVIVNAQGQQVTFADKPQYLIQSYTGSAAIKDIDNDGRLDIISGGTNTTQDKSVIYRFINDYALKNTQNRYARQQFREPDLGHQRTQILDFVRRFYKKILNRTADTTGLLYWNSALTTQKNSGAELAWGFIFSTEFSQRNTNNNDFITLLYQAFFDREPDSNGFNDWLSRMNNGLGRQGVLNGFIYSTEFYNLAKNYGILGFTDSAFNNFRVEQFVNSIILGLLSTEANQIDLDTYKNNIINKTQNANDLVTILVNSNSFKIRNLNNNDYIKTLYQALIRRLPTTEENTNALNILNNNGRTVLLNNILSYDEFKSYHISYGIL